MQQASTDWDFYYDKPYKSASLSRKITASLLHKICKKHIMLHPETIIELGAGDSCFYNLFNELFSPHEYIAIDYNRKGLDKFTERVQHKSLHIIEADLLKQPLPAVRGQLVMSFGLIEHFEPIDTAKMIKAHFDLLYDEGYCLITFPTPTILYRAIRKIAEVIGVWIFHDERALQMDEVLNEVRKYGRVVYAGINWEILLTQGVILVHKKLNNERGQ